MEKGRPDEALNPQFPLFIQHIRPYQVLGIEDAFSDELRFFMPPTESAGTLTAIESVMLLKPMRAVNPDYIFEFGTYKGLTTRLLLENLPDTKILDERIYTLDLPSTQGIDFLGTDQKLAVEAVDYTRAYLSSHKQHLVRQLLQDCLTLDETQFLKKFQFIFIDGNHDVKYAQSDTEKALAMLAVSPSCVVWHDYTNPQFPELTAYIDELASSISIYHIQDTMLAFHLNGIEIFSRPPV